MSTLNLSLLETLPPDLGRSCCYFHFIDEQMTLKEPKWPHIIKLGHTQVNGQQMEREAFAEKGILC